MGYSKYFEKEIQLIKNENLRDFVQWFFDCRVGDWFYKSGASSTGKHHPKFAQGEGGLVRHTRAVVLFCEELLRLNSYAYMKDEYKDYSRIACLLHDICKYGEGHKIDKACYKEHGALAAKKVAQGWTDFFNTEPPELMLMAIRSHMGQWTENKENRPFTSLDRLVHLADYIASRSFLDIPCLLNEYSTDKLDVVSANKESAVEDDFPL